MSDQVRIWVRHVDTHGSAADAEDKYTLVAQDGERVVGHMDITVYRNVAHVDWVEVSPGHRRRGVARALYRRLYEWAGEERLGVKHGMTTEEGAATLEALLPELKKTMARTTRRNSRNRMTSNRERLKRALMRG